VNSKLPLQELNQKEILDNESSPAAENILRPKKLSEYIGQEAVAGKLEVFMAAAKQRKKVLDHVLLAGPPGLGKTTLAYIIAREMGGRLHMTSGPVLDKPVDAVALLSNLNEGDVLFIDEIHRLGKVVEETLYPAMEDGQVQIVIGEGAAAQSVNLPLQKFTLIGATTQSGRLSAPLRDRFGIQFNLDFYSQEEMQEILERSSKLLEIDLDSQEICAIAKRSRGTPRVANRLLSRVRDFVDVYSDDQIKLSKKATRLMQQGEGQLKVEKALSFLEVDDKGLQPLDRNYLRTLIKRFDGGPAGLEAICASMSEDRSTIEEQVEPFLLKLGFIVRSPRGRIACDQAYSALGLKRIASKGPQQALEL